MGWPVVIATNGYGIPVTESDSDFAIPAEIADNGYGTPVVLVDSGGTPVKGVGGGAAPGAETFTVSTVDDNIMVIGPVQLLEVRRVGGSSETIALYDSAYSASGTAVFSQLMSASDIEVCSPPLEFINGIYAVISPPGTELVTNGTFDTDASGWTAQLGATLSHVSDGGGRLQIVSGGSGVRATQTVSGLSIGQTYEVSAQIASVAGGVSTALLRLTTDTAGSATGQIYASSAVAAGGSLSISTSFVAAATSITIAFALGAGLTVQADNVSLKLLSAADGTVELELAP